MPWCVLGMTLPFMVAPDETRRRSATQIAVFDVFLGLASQAITARRSAAGQATSRNDLIVEHVDTINSSRGATVA